MTEFHAIVHGQVQGVWYRAWTRDAARETGVTGWVRNCPDGTVEAVAQGERELLDTFLTRLWDGPPLARVADIDLTWSEPDEVFDDFSVRR